MTFDMNGIHNFLIIKGGAKYISPKKNCIIFLFIIFPTPTAEGGVAIALRDQGRGALVAGGAVAHRQAVGAAGGGLFGGRQGRSLLVHLHCSYRLFYSYNF